MGVISKIYFPSNLFSLSNTNIQEEEGGGLKGQNLQLLFASTDVPRTGITQLWKTFWKRYLGARDDAPLAGPLPRDAPGGHETGLGCSCGFGAQVYPCERANPAPLVTVPWRTA